MPHTNASFSPMNRAERLQRQLHRLEGLSEQGASTEDLAAFDVETERLLLELYGQRGGRLESYKYATLGEAEAIVNLPESAQLPTARDRPKKALQQRRQVLQGCIAELQEMERKEADVLTGEDREDPPGMN